MDWHTIWAIVTSIPSEIIVLLVVLSTIATYFIYNTFDSGLYITSIAWAAMFTSGILGHVVFFMNGIFFTNDVGRSAVIGATLSMSCCFIVAILFIRLTSDAVYSRYKTRGPEEFKLPITKRI